MAKPNSLPPQALAAVPEKVLEHLQGLPPATAPEHELPPTSVALPDEALPLPLAAQVPEWLLS
jgi:hypothetical protein